MRTETKLNIAVAAAVALLAAAFKLSAAPTANEDYVDAQDAQTYTNALRDAKAYTDAATGAVRRVDGEARVLPRYLHTLKFYDSYPDVADWYYSRYGRVGGACSSVRDGNTLARNYDWDFDAAPSFVIGMDAGPCRFASVGVASVGTNLTEDAVTRGRPSKFYKALPGMTLDGVNENGVAANVNVVSSFGHTNGWHGSALHCLGAVRWVLDHATNAQHGAEFLAANVYVPQSMIDEGYSYHYMIADAAETWIAEDGQARVVGTAANRSVMTNFRNFDPLADPYGTGRERYTLLENGGSITSAWFTLAYVSPGRESEFRAPGVDAAAACARAVASWATKPKEQHRGETFEGGAHWWQSVHTSVYDLNNHVLRVAVQEVDDWYTFAVPSGGVKPNAVREIVSPMIGAATNGLRRVEDMAVYEVVRTENTDWTWTSANKALEDELNSVHIKPWWDGVGWEISDPPSFYWNRIESENPQGRGATEIVAEFSDGSAATARRPRYMDETFAHSTNAVLATIATNGTGAVSSGDLMKLDADGRLIKATVGADYADEATGTDRQVIRGGYCDEFGWDIRVYSAEQADEAFSVEWSNVYGKPYTLEGYGISDGATKTELAAKQDALPYPTNAIPASAINDFANAVLAVGLNIDTNSVAVLNEIAATFGDFPITGTATTVGGLLAALAAAVAWLRKRAAHLDNSGFGDDDFATDILGKQVAISAIDARIKTNAESASEPTNAVTINDNAPKTVTVATVESPATPSLAVTFGTARNGGLRICELYILNGTADTDLTFDAETVHFVGTGDSFPACEAGINYFVFAEVAANLWKVTRETLKSITTPTTVSAV